MNAPELSLQLDERRRSLRRAAHELAQLIVGTESVPVVVRDFSDVGLFLTFSDAKPDADRMRGWIGVQACVDLQPSAVHAPIDPLQVRIVHALVDGVGVQIDGLPAAWAARFGVNTDAALNAPELDASLTRRARGKPLASEPAVASGDSNRALLERCIKAYTAFSKTFANDCIARAVEELGALEGTEPFLPVRRQYEDARVLLTEQHSAIVNQFSAESARRALAGPQHELLNFDASANVGSLRLMDTDELDSYLSLTSIIKSLDEQLAKQQQYFLARYQQLAAGVNAKNNPFGIERTLRSLIDALSSVTLASTASRVLFGAISQSATTRIPVLFTELNQILSGVTPAELPVVASTSRARERAKEAITQHGLAADDQAVRVIDALRQSRWSGDQQVPQRALAVIEAMSQGRSVLIDGASVPGAPGAAISEPSMGGASIPGALAPSVSMPIEGFAGAIELSPLDASVPEVIHAINTLPPSTGKPFDEASVSRIADQIRQATAKGQAPRTLGGDHNRMLATTAKLFQRASQDIVADGDVQRLLKRLEGTLLKLSLRDNDFPSLGMHPARKVVNLIDQYALGANDAGRFEDEKLRRGLDTLVDRICEHADRDPNIFAVVHRNLEQDLERVRRERRERVDRVCEALESRDRIRAARQHVDNLLRERLSGRRLPRILVGLIDEFWRQHLVMLYVRFGDRDERFVGSVNLLERAFAVCGESSNDLATTTLSRELCVALSEAIAGAATDPNLARRLTDELTRLMMNREPEAIDDSVDSPVFTSAAAPEPAAKAAVASSTETASPSVADTAKSPPAADAFEASQLGAWFDLLMGGRATPVQVIWKSALTGHVGMVNRSATQRIELTAAQFQQQIDAKTLRSRDSLDTLLLDRSEAALLGTAYAESVQVHTQSSQQGLLSRKAFQARLNSLDADVRGGRQHVVGVFEFDQYRTIAATCGSEAIESLTAALVAKLQAKLPTDALFGSMRDDTVAVLLPDCLAAAGEKSLQNALTSLADFHFKFQQHSYSIGVNVGVATLGVKHSNAADVLRHADAACLAAKAIERNRLQRYEADSEATRSEEKLMNWSGRVDGLLAGNDLFMRAQMVTPIGQDVAALPYYELLLGIEPLDGAPVSTFDFIVTMERLGRSHEIDLWVLRQCFAWIEENSLIMDSIGGLAINLSVPSLSHPAIMAYLREVLPRGGFPANKVIFEITETAAIRNFDAAEQFIRSIRRYGCKFSLDDFGSGYTSYAHLKQLSTDTLKIDGSYVKDILNNPSDLAIVKSMTDIAHTLGMKVVAEWVETPAILEKLIELGVDYAQGYAVHKPVRLSRLIG